MNPDQPTSYNSGNVQTSRSKLLIIIVLVILLATALGFGGWAYSQMQSYKNNTNQKIEAALSAAKDSQTKQVQDAFDKANTKQYAGPAVFGTISFSYPKTWSAYIDTTSQSEPINGYFFPNIVPGIQSKTAFALRMELVSTDYNQILQQFQSQIKTGRVTAKVYVPPKLNGVNNVTPGTLLSGTINNQDQTQHGTMLVIKVRDKTLQLSTQSNDYLNDFNSIVLSSLTFSP
ncbi:MAG TPA: hypothetical protein VFH37_00560 [Candidatus Saccharimonadales bacterium]|nr:hypothetical protein [Candidatus Saccharimonadales bacterium]